MNLTCVDMSNYNVSLGDEIEIISSDPKTYNSIYALAEKSATIPYEVLVKLDPKMRRVIK